MLHLVYLSVKVCLPDSKMADVYRSSESCGRDEYTLSSLSLSNEMVLIESVAL